MLRSFLPKLPQEERAWAIRAGCMHPNPDVRSEYAQHAGSHMDLVDDHLALTLSRDPEWLVRCDATALLGLKATPVCLRRLRTMAKSDNVACVRAWAIVSLADHYFEDREAIRPFFTELRAREKQEVPLFDLVSWFTDDDELAKIIDLVPFLWSEPTSDWGPRHVVCGDALIRIMEAWPDLSEERRTDIVKLSQGRSINGRVDEEAHRFALKELKMDYWNPPFKPKNLPAYAIRPGTKGPPYEVTQ